MRIPRLLAAVTAVGCALMLCGCSHATSTPGHSETALQGALGQVADTTFTRASLLFSRPDAIGVADQSDVAGPYRDEFDIGLGNLGPLSNQVPTYLGFDAAGAATAVIAGFPPHNSSLLTGTSTGGVAAKMTRLGAKKEGAFYRLAPDGRLIPPEVDEDSPKAALLVGLDVLQTAGTTIRYSNRAAGLRTFQPTGRTLADVPAVRSTSACLGNPLAAEILDSVPPVPAKDRTATGMTLAKDVHEVGVGVSGRRGITPTVKLCVIAQSAGDATDVERAMRTAVGSGLSRTRDEPWSDLLTNATVIRSGSTVELSAQANGESAEVLFAGELPGFSG